MGYRRLAIGRSICAIRAIRGKKTFAAFVGFAVSFLRVLRGSTTGLNRADVLRFVSANSYSNLCILIAQS